MSDHIIIENVCPTIKLYQQYRKNDPAANFFAWLKVYWQDKYFDFIMAEIVPQLSSCNATSEYLQFFAKYWYGIQRPVDVTGVHRYDDPDVLWDNSEYDYRTDAGVIAIERFKDIIDFILDWTEPNWNIPLLFRMVRGFTGLQGDDIAITQDATRPDVFLISMPNNARTALFTSLVINYKSLWQLPYGIDIEITLT